MFFFFFGVAVLLLSVFYLPQAIDRTLAPRLLALSSLLLVSIVLVFRNQHLFHWDFSIWRRKLFYFWIAFFAVTVFSAFFAKNPMESYLFIVRNMLFVIGLAIAALILFNTSEWEERLSKIYVLTAGVALLIGFVQFFDRVYFSPLEQLDDGRPLIYLVTGLFSHKNFFSSALMLMLPFTAFGIYAFRKKWRIAAIIVSIGILVMILILKTRSIWVGFMAAGFVTVLILLFYSKVFRLGKTWRIVLLSGLFAGVAGVVMLFNLGDASDEFSVAGRMRSIFDTQSQHNVHRLFIWEKSLEIIKDEPVTGVGAGNWMLYIPKYFDRNFEHLEALGWRQPHNDYLWIASEKGVAALVIYIAAFICLLWYSLKVIKNKDDTIGVDSKVLALLLVSGIITFLADSFFSFPYERIDVMVLLMVIASAAIVLYHRTAGKRSFVPKKLIFLPAGILLTVFSAVYSYQSINMERGMGRALVALQQNSWDQMLYHANAAKTPFRSLGPHLYPPEFLEGVAHQNQEHYRRAVASFEKARQQAPYDIRILHLLGSNYRRVEQLDDAYDCFMELMRIYPPSPSITEDIKRLVVDLSAQRQYQQAHDLLTYIPRWEDDAEISRNVQALETLMQREAENQ